MNNNVSLRELLIDAELARLENGKMKKFAPSDKFKLKLNKTLKENGSKPYYGFFSVKRRRVLAVIAAVVLLFALCMNVTAVRETLFGFFINIFDDHSTVYVDKSGKERPKTVTEFYRPSYVPEGYEVKSEDRSAICYGIFWENVEQSYIDYSQSTYNSVIGFDTAESMEIRYLNEELTVNIYRTKHSVSVFWQDGKYVYNITAFKPICEDELIKMALSLKKTEFTESS